MNVVKNYFMNVVIAKVDTQRAFKKYKEASEDFSNITGIDYSKSKISGTKTIGFADLIGNIEELYNNYLKEKAKFNLEYDKCMVGINQLNNQLYKLIIEYTYIDREIDQKSDKETLKVLNDYHNIDISYAYFRKVKSKAKKEFENIIETL
jgi:hypothetical protein